MAPRPVTLLPVAGIPEITAGADMAELVAAHVTLRDDDVVVVAQKAVSKAEGALVPVPPGEDPDTFRRRHATGIARRVVADVPWVTIVETPHGLVCANAGLDTSNAPGGYLVALPEDPDASARRFAEDLKTRTGADVAVVITDTFGRPWRLGQTEVAIGASGIGVLRHESRDQSGRELAVTEPAIADALAAATDLVRGKADGVPVVVVRGAMVDRSETSSATELQRSGPSDLFARGAGQLATALAEPGGPMPNGPAGAWQVARISAAARGAVAAMLQAGGDQASVTVRTAEGDGATVVHIAAGPMPADIFAAGMATMAAVAAAKDLGLAAHLDGSAGQGQVRVRVGTAGDDSPDAHSLDFPLNP